jgi:hypothetical protein
MTMLHGLETSEMLRNLFQWWEDHQDRQRIHALARYWHQQGAVSPYSMAEEERYLRLKLEEFRSFASRRYLEDQKLLLDDLKQEWLDLSVKPMSRLPETRETAKTLKAAIAVMGDEMFVGEAKRVRRSEIAAALTRARETAPVARTEMRQRAFRLR